jgi:protein required for attachment to host cells
MRPVNTWILIADGAHARLFVNDGVGKGIAPALDEEFIGVNLPSREIASDRPGRTFDSYGPQRHAMEPPTDPRRYERIAFARALAGRLEEARKAGVFERLVVVAPPEALGDLRGEFSKPLQDMVSGELAKNLIKVPIHELPEHLGAVLAL